MQSHKYNQTHMAIVSFGLYLHGHIMYWHRGYCMTKIAIKLNYVTLANKTETFCSGLPTKSVHLIIYTSSLSSDEINFIDRPTIAYH